MVQLKIKLHWIVFVALAWSYLIQPTLGPGLAPLIRVGILAAGILWMTFLYRAVEFDVVLTTGDLQVFGAYALIFAWLQSKWLVQSLGCDELYHSERAVFYLHGLKFLPEGCCWDAFQRMPITELNSLLMVGFAAFVAVAGLLWARFKRHMTGMKTRYGVYFVICSAVGLGAVHFNVPPEAHPPLRLFPLFVAQALFGLQDMSFRLPGIAALALISFFAYRLVQRESKSQSWFFPFVIGFSLYMIPTVFHVALIVQPSVWGFAAACGSLLALIAAVRHKDDKLLILASVIIGLGCLMRQNAVILWPAFVVICWLNRSWIRRWVLVLAPILFIGPYAVTVVRIGHPVAQIKMFEPSSGTAASAQPTSPIDNIENSIATKMGPRSIWKSSSPPWVLFTLIGIGIVFMVYRGSLKAYYLTFLVGYALFFSLVPSSWGVGRYQAEFVAPCTAATILILALLAKNRQRTALSGVLIYLGLFSFFFNDTVPQDHSYDFWSRKRLSTESTFPYKEALGFVQKQESGGRFVIVGGVPTYGRMIVWLRGFNYFETETYWAAQDELNQKLAGFTLDQFLDFCRHKDLSYFLVQYGDKRERQHRSSSLQALLDDLGGRSAAGSKASLKDYILQKSYQGDVDASIDVFGIPRRRYL